MDRILNRIEIKIRSVLGKVSVPAEIEKWDFSQEKVPFLGYWLPVVDGFRTLCGLSA
jgi:hypothetical protein